MKINEALTVKTTIHGRKPVNIFVGRFQPFTLGHVKVIEQMYNENKLPTVIFLIKSKKKGREDSFKRPYSEEMQIRMIKKVKRDYPIEDVIVLPSAAIDKMFNELRPDYEPVLWGTGTDRMKAYGYQVNREEYRIDLNVRDDFRLFEIKRGDENISATKVRNAMLDNDKEKFEMYTPRSIHGMYSELRSVLMDGMKRDGLLERNNYVLSYEQFIKNN